MASDNLKYGGKPIYSGSAKKSPIYYGVSGNAPYYYGGGNYGRPAAGYDDPSQDPNSLVGTITPARVLRVISQRWITVLVFLLVGLVASFAVYRISPTIYEAKSEFTMQMRSPKTSAPGALGQITEIDYGNTYEEVFNTRLSDWRSEKLITKIMQQYRANHPASTVSDEELLETLAESELELVRRSRLITIAVRSGSAQLAADLANSYAEAIESFTDEENRLRCDKAVAQISDQVKKQRSVDERVSEALLNFRKTHKVDNLKSEREIVQQSLQKVTADVLDLDERGVQ